MLFFILNFFMLHCHIAFFNSFLQWYKKLLVFIVITSYGVLASPAVVLRDQMDIRTVLALEYFVTLYPLVFTVALYVVIELHAKGCKPLVTLWRPFHPLSFRFRKVLNIRGSIHNLDLPLLQQDI